MPKLPIFDRLLAAYARGPDHPIKLRVISWIVKLLGTRRVRAWCGFGLMELDLRDLIQFSLFMNMSFEPTTRARVKDYLRPGDLFIDVGANVGLFSIIAAQKGARVVAVEPNPRICAELLVNRALNRLEESLLVVSAGAGERVDVVPFGIPFSENRGTSRQMEIDAGDTVQAPILPLCEICELLGVRRIRLVKIDVEGAELRVLRGLLEGRFALKPDSIVFEYKTEQFRYSDAPHGLIDYLESAGYEIESLDGAPYYRHGPIEEFNLWARLR